MRRSSATTLSVLTLRRYVALPSVTYSHVPIGHTVFHDLRAPLVNMEWKDAEVDDGVGVAVVFDEEKEEEDDEGYEI
jgi:hypothetical protein